MTTEDEVRARSVRRPRSELKQLVLRGAVEILNSADLVLSLESLSYVRVFEHLKEHHGVSVTRGSVHERIWSSVEEFRLEALLQAVDEPELLGYEAMERFVEEIFATSDLASEDGRREALVRICRDAMPRYEEVEHSAERWTVIALQILASMPEHEPGPAVELADRLHHVGQFWEDRFLESFASLFDTLQMQVRPELGIDQETAVRTFVRWAIDLKVGQRLHEKGTRTNRPTISFSPAGGEKGEWSSFGLACYAMLQHLFVGK